MTTVTWNAVSSATIPELTCGKVTRQLIGEHRGKFVTIPGRPGSHYFPEERGRRKITIECFIMAADSSFPAGRRDAVTEVADWVDINAECQLILSDAPNVYYNAVLVDPPDVDEWRELGTFDLVFEADPYAYDNTGSSHLFAMESGVEQSYDFGLSAQTWPIIEVTPTNGTTTTGFTLEVSGQTFTYDAIVSTGDTVTINAISMAVLAGTSNDVNITGAYDPVDLLMSGVSGTFPLLIPGSNDITITSLGGTADEFDVNFIYRKRYRN
jgi:predicted phage tail component-like protein